MTTHAHELEERGWSETVDFTDLVPVLSAASANATPDVIRDAVTQVTDRMRELLELDVTNRQELSDVIARLAAANNFNDMDVNLERFYAWAQRNHVWIQV